MHHMADAYVHRGHSPAWIAYGLTVAPELTVGLAEQAITDEANISDVCSKMDLTNVRECLLML